MKADIRYILEAGKYNFVGEVHAMMFELDHELNVCYYFHIFENHRDGENFDRAFRIVMPTTQTYVSDVAVTFRGRVRGKGVL